MVLRTKSSEYVCASLPEGSHDDNPAEAIAIQNRLGKMSNGEKTEEDRKDDRNTEAGRVLP